MKWNGERYRCRNCGEIYPFSLTTCNCGGVCDKIADAPKPDNKQKSDPSVSPDSLESTKQKEMDRNKQINQQNGNLPKKKRPQNSDQQSNNDENKEVLIGCVFFVFIIFCSFGGIRMLFSSSVSTLSDPVVKLKDIDDRFVRISWNPITNADYYVLQNQSNDLPSTERKTIILVETAHIVQRDDNRNTEYSLIACTNNKNYKSSSSVKIFIESAKSHSGKRSAGINPRN